MPFSSYGHTHIQRIESGQTCPTEEGCLVIPSRNTEQGFIPSANIFYRLRGNEQCSKKTLVFVHGYQATAEDWVCQQADLCHCYRTLSLDLRGFGRSSKTPTTFCDPIEGIDYTMEVFADDVRAVLDELEIGNRIIFIGEGMGAGVGINFAARYPNQLRKLVLVSGAPVFYTTDVGVTPFCDCPTPTDGACYPFAKTDIDLLFQNISLVCCETKTGNLAQCLTDQILSLFLNEQCDAANEQALLLQRSQQLASYRLSVFLEPCSLEVEENVANNALRQDQRSLLAQIQVPTLIMYGLIDNYVAPQNSSFIHSAIENSFLIGFVGKGHLPNNTAVSQFNSELVKFIKGNTPKIPYVVSGPCDVCDVPLITLQFCDVCTGCQEPDNQ